MTTKTGIIYLQRDKFQVYSPYLPNILEFRFVPELIRDYDLVNKTLFENLLKVFLGNNKIPPSGMAIVVSDSASFMKDFVSPPQPITPNPQQQQTPPPTLEDLKNAANEYLEHIPFEEVASKVFPLATGVRAYATNQEMYETIKILLEKQGFIIQSVLPGFVFGPNLSNRATLDGPGVSEILQKISTLQGYNLLKDAPQVQVAAVTEETEEKENTTSDEEVKLEKPENKNVMIAVAISAIVLIVAITGVVVYLQFQTRPYSPPPKQVQQAPAPTAAPQASQTVASVEAGELTAQITGPSSAASTSAALRLALTNFGFQSIVPQTQDTLGSSSNLLFFSSRVSQDIRASVTESVKKIVPDILVQERPDASFDITVILGQ